MRRGLAYRTIAGAAGALALMLPAAALAEPETSTTASGATTTTVTSTTPSEASPPPATQTGSTGTQTATTTTSSTGQAPAAANQAPQRGTARGGAAAPQKRSPRSGGPSTRPGRKAPSSAKAPGSPAPAPKRAGRGLAPLPFALRTPVSGLPSLFLEAYDVPPFLLPIYQAAGIAYGVPWQVLAAINEVESDYGRDLNVSSAGAEGWMQFLPVEWRQWGVDAGESGYVDPYNPADAIFAAARYLSAAGGAAHIRAAVFAYNHSQAYVESVMLRAQLLGSLPPEMLGAVTDLTEARFPVHAAAHFGDGFTTAAASGGGSGARTIVGTTIHSQPGAPAIAVKDGTIVAIGDSPALGLHLSLRDAYGDVFTYADLGEVASLYPVLAPRARGQGAHAAGARRPAPAPSGPATAGAQPHPLLSRAGTASAFTFGIVEALGSLPRIAHRAPSAPRPAPRRRLPRTRSFLEGPERVYLRPLRPGAQVIAGTVLGHLGTGADPRLLFQVRPGGSRSPLVDPKPLLDSWVALEDTGVFGARGEDPFLSISPTAGQALLESRGQLQQQVLRDRGIGLSRCDRREVEAGHIDRRVLATLELLSVSRLHPTVARMRCGGRAPRGLRGYASGDAADIVAVNGVPIAGHAGPGGVADAIERRLLALQGTMKPDQVAGPVEYLDARDAISSPSSRDLVHVAFPRLTGSAARLASAGSTLGGSEWTALDERLAQIPDATVSQTPSPAAIPDARRGGAQEGGR